MRPLPTLALLAACLAVAAGACSTLPVSEQACNAGVVVTGVAIIPSGGTPSNFNISISQARYLKGCGTDPARINRVEWCATETTPLNGDLVILFLCPPATGTGELTVANGVLWTQAGEDAISALLGSNPDAEAETCTLDTCEPRSSCSLAGDDAAASGVTVVIIVVAIAVALMVMAGVAFCVMRRGSEYDFEYTFSFGSYNSSALDYKLYSVRSEEEPSSGVSLTASSASY